MAKRRKKEKRVASVDEMEILKRDLLNTGIWIGIAVASVGVLVFFQQQFSLF
jgi:hypothetical protein